MAKIDSSYRKLTVIGAAIAGLAFALPAIGQSQQPHPGVLLTGKSAVIGDWSSDEPGVRRLIKVGDMPAPFATPSVRNPAGHGHRPSGWLPKAPPGFIVSLVATVHSKPRHLTVAPNGDVFVTESIGGRIQVLRGGAANGAVRVSTFAAGLHLPFGLAFYPAAPNPEYVYVANTDSVVRFRYRNGDLVASGPPETVVPSIPGGSMQGVDHWTRDIAFSRDGRKLYVSVGSHSNDTPGPAEYHRGDILEYTPDGKNLAVYATGIRNPVGLAVDPSTGFLWTSVNERDTMGDLLPPDFVTRVRPGGFYGWPWFYIGSHRDPRAKGATRALETRVLVPDVLLQAHSASMQMTFYNASQFPKAYQGGAFACEHGSSNRARRTGYKVIYMPMLQGKATGEYDDFLTGFVLDDKAAWGRPVGIAVAADGSLFVSEDSSNTIWRVRYVGRH